jgi:hypothetical protein
MALGAVQSRVELNKERINFDKIGQIFSRIHTLLAGQSSSWISLGRHDCHWHSFESNAAEDRKKYV